MTKWYNYLFTPVVSFKNSTMPLKKLAISLTWSPSLFMRKMGFCPFIFKIFSNISLFSNYGAIYPYLETQQLENWVLLITRFQDFRVIPKFYHSGLADMAFSIKISEWNSILTNRVPYKSSKPTWQPIIHHHQQLPKLNPNTETQPSPPPPPQ